MLRVLRSCFGLVVDRGGREQMVDGRDGRGRPERQIGFELVCDSVDRFLDK